MFRRILPLWLSFSLVVWAQGPVEELLAQVQVLYDRWHGTFDFAQYETRLREALDLWEKALGLVQDQHSRRLILVNLSRAWFELAEGYLQDEREKEAAYGKGKDYALDALRADEEFMVTERKEGLRAALRGSVDVEALFWYGNNLGRWLRFHYWEALTGGPRDVLAAFERCAELDEAYWAGGPRRALANFLAQTPGFLGGDFSRAKKEFQRALELAPEFLQNYVDYAEQWAKKAGDDTLFCALLREVLARGQDSAVFLAWPFYNTLALARAVHLSQGCR